VDKAKAGLKCPHCATGFVPDQVDVTMEAETFTPQPNLTEAERRRGTAGNLVAIALVCLFVSLICVFVAVVSAINGEDSWTACQAAGALVGVAFMLGVIGQLMHIRAALEDRNKRG
jgi:hypothetical protein